MSAIIEKLEYSVEFGKINKVSPYPPELKGEDGADELCKQALEAGSSPYDILHSLTVAMDKVGKKFAENKIFIPQMLLAAKAMSAAMAHLKPHFQSGAVVRKGVFVIGTVFGDLHDIGKNIVKMMVEGAGWEVIDLGVDVKIEKYIETIKQYPKCVVGVSALLTTTMLNIETLVKALKADFADVKIIIGGAPLTMDFCKKIGADFYSPSPQGAVEYLNSLK